MKPLGLISMAFGYLSGQAMHVGDSCSKLLQRIEGHSKVVSSFRTCHPDIEYHNVCSAHIVVAHKNC